MKMNIWINWRFKMWSKRNKLWCMQLINLFFILLVLADVTCASKSTLEKIKKHQEWLKQRNQQQQQQQYSNHTTTLALSSYKKPYDLANLWRFPTKQQISSALTPIEQQQQQQQQQQLQKQNLEKPSRNDVYPENEVLIVTTMPSNVINATTTAPPSIFVTTTTTLAPEIITTPSSTTTTSDTPMSNQIITEMSNAETTTTGTPTNTTTATVLNNVLPLNATNSPFDSDSNQKSDDNMSSIKQPLTTIATTTTTTQTLKTPITETPLSLGNATILTTTTTTTTTPKPLTSNRKVVRKPIKKPRPYPRWGNWSKWTDCSRACGGGVMLQQRKCINRNSSTGKRYVSNDCVGIYRRYQLCNEQPCENVDLDFRAVQCEAFNEVNFQGRKYIWEPYIKEDAECELNCKPVGMKYFATLNATVIDGTSCYRPAEYYRSNYRNRAICVSGICKALQANGLIAGLSANSGSVSCGGLICRPITGIFTRDPLPEDAYIHVATIPAGASNISITELKNSMNLLVLRSVDQKYIFNGDNTASESGAYEAVGATFDYHRIDGLQHGDGVTEWITCTGPIREMLELMIYSKSMNPGIKYEYLLPIASDSEENELSLESDGFLKAGVEENSVSSSRSTRRRKYNWKVIGFSTCSKSCGGGTQTPIVRCVRDNPIRFYSQRRCMHAEKPLLNENLLRCNTQPCPAYWRVDEWEECRCHQGEGFRSREVNCVQELASGIVIHVDNIACMEEQPMTKKQCDCPKNRRRSHSRYRVQNSNSTHSQQQRQRGGSLYSGEKMGGVWLMSDWNQYCSAECGDGVEYRTIFCDRLRGINSERCDPRSTPDITRPCERATNCDHGDWFAGPWSSCNGNCFNLTRSRLVYCIQNQLIVDDEDCRPELRPQNVENCLHEEVEYCAPRWHYSEWTECSKSCDGGTQRRSVKCLEYDDKENTLRDSNKCRYSQREPTYRSCNIQTCEELPPRLELLQNDVAVSCVDEFANCQWAVKAKLCSYKYYQENCCYSCGAV